MKSSISRKSGLNVNTSVEGESIINMVEKLINNKETIKDGKALVYTEKADGVLQAYNIRADRFDIAIDAMDKVNKSYTARKEGTLKVVKEDDGVEPISGTLDQ